LKDLEMHGIRRKSLDGALKRSSINEVHENSNSNTLVPNTDPDDDIESNKNDL